MNTDELHILKQFKGQLILFLDELINQFPEEPDLVITRIYIKDQAPIKDIMNIFLHKILPVKDKVNVRDEKFFLSNDSQYLYHELENNKVKHFKRLWMSGKLDSDDKRIIWQWIDSFVFYAERYQKCLN